MKSSPYDNLVKEIINELTGLAEDNRKIALKRNSREIQFRARGYYLAAYAVALIAQSHGVSREDVLTLPSYRCLRSRQGRLIEDPIPKRLSLGNKHQKPQTQENDTNPNNQKDETAP